MGTSVDLDGCGNFVPTGIRFPNHPARSVSLYRWANPAHNPNSVRSYILYRFCIITEYNSIPGIPSIAFRLLSSVGLYSSSRQNWQVKSLICYMDWTRNLGRSYRYNITWRRRSLICQAHCSWQRPPTTRPTTFHVWETRGCQCSLRLLMMGGVSSETCWASYKYGIITFWYIVVSCRILLYEFYYDALIHEYQTWKCVRSIIPTENFHQI